MDFEARAQSPLAEPPLLPRAAQQRTTAESSDPLCGTRCTCSCLEGVGALAFGAPSPPPHCPPRPCTPCCRPGAAGPRTSRGCRLSQLRACDPSGATPLQRRRTRAPRRFRTLSSPPTRSARRATRASTSCPRGSPPRQRARGGAGATARTSPRNRARVAYAVASPACAHPRVVSSCPVTR